jgi:hypothetical protein
MALSKQLQRIHEAIMTIKQLGGVFGRNPTFNNVTIEGTLTFDGDIDINSDLTISGNLYLPDNSKAIFGDGSDLQIYHTGTNSILKSSTGEFLLQGDGITLRGNSPTETMLTGDVNGAITLHYDSLAKLATTSTGIDVTGTVTADGLTVDNGASKPTATIVTTGIGGGDTPTLIFHRNSDLLNNNVQVGVHLWQAGTAANSVAGIFVDHVGTSENAARMEFYTAESGNFRQRQRIAENGDISFYSSDGLSQALFWDASAESLGIGTSSPAQMLHLSGTVPDIQYTDTTGNEYRLGNNNGAFRLYDVTAAAERMRIDSSGNLLVGTTSVGIGDAGIELRADGQITGTRDGDYAALLNRLTSDGDIIDFRKDGTTVGSIASTFGTDIHVGTGDTRLRFVDQNDYIRPANSDGSSRDGLTDLGASTGRFKDLYRSGSTISTSDRNMKQDERDLSEAETRVAQACKGLLKAFRFIDAVQVDGDGARIHFGIIAQDLQAAFETEGLDATKYAMFRPSTLTDDEGDEQVRLGVCYENLLAFIIAAI